MDSNNMYQNQQGTGGAPGNDRSVNYDGNSYQNDNAYNQNTYGQNQNYQDPYNQSGNYQQYPYNNNYNNYNGNYQAPYGQSPQMELEEPVKMSEWLLTFLIGIIPSVNIVMCFVWAFSSTEKKSKSNFFKAYLLAMGILLAFYLLLIIVGVATGIAIEGAYY